jgi:3-hydroxypropanoate dehydrogenase
MTLDTRDLTELDLPATTAAGALAVGDDVADLLFREAHTTHAFTDEAVSEESVRAVYDLIRWAPTAMNIVPLRLLLVRTPEARQRLAAHVADGNRDRVLAAPLTLVAAADTNFHQHMGTLAPWAAGMVDGLEADLAKRTGMAVQSATIQIGYLITGLRAAGLTVGPMGGFDNAGVDGEFFADNGWTSLLVINVGQPAAENASHPRAARLDYDQVSITL